MKYDYVSRHVMSLDLGGGGDRQTKITPRATHSRREHQQDIIIKHTQTFIVVEYFSTISRW